MNKKDYDKKLNLICRMAGNIMSFDYAMESETAVSYAIEVFNEAVRQLEESILEKNSSDKELKSGKE